MYGHKKYKKAGNTILSKKYNNTLVISTKERQIDEMPDKEFIRMIIRMLEETQKNTGRQLNKIRKTVPSINEKLNKGIEMLGKNQAEILQMSTSSKKKKRNESFNNRLDEAEECLNSNTNLFKIS